ncbi:MAG: AAA family ATPase, partial [[Eubacterium] saphenum]|nr:AAA family ATPase [[Eubacterium] saphenum]
RLNLHMCFYGNPGTGKTEVARIIAGILYENKILPSNKVIEVDRSGLVGQYVGETPQKTMVQIEKAMGGVLFIDEAYALVPKDGGFDYGNEAVATLIKAMEDHRGEFCVILAGYRNQLHEMISTNPGFKSRIQFELDFPNYSREELGEITKLMLRKRGYVATEEATQKMLDITDIRRKEPNFANAREIRNLLDQVIMCQNLRSSGTDDNEIGIVDVNQYIMDSNIKLPISGSGAQSRILTAEEELDQLIGLSSVKRMVKKIKAYAKRNKQEESFNLHMCFYGNPGTGKTEVARILSRILYDAGVLAEAKLVETDSYGLIGKFVGETAPKTEGKIQDAMGGVLFIDEAYGLSSESGNGSPKSYGEEAIAVLLKEMEDHRGQFCVIFAGYQKEMQSMIATNPGLKSRIQFTLEFPDYTREELGEIALAFLGKKGYVITEDALGKLLDVTEYYREKPDFANARTVRNILDQVIMNQNLRTENDEELSNLIVFSDVEDYITDEKIDLKDTRSGTRRIGFV